MIFISQPIDCGHWSGQQGERKLQQKYRSDDKSLARQGRKQATVTEDFQFHISYL